MTPELPDLPAQTAATPSDAPLWMRHPGWVDAAVCIGLILLSLPLLYVAAQEGQVLWALLCGALFVVLIGADLWWRRHQRHRLVAAEQEATRLLLAREQAGLMAAANERTKIAREMHDVVAHSLAVMVTMADGVAATIEKNPQQAREACELLSETGRSALADTRRLVGVLRGVVDDGGVRGTAAQSQRSAAHTDQQSSVAAVSDGARHPRRRSLQEAPVREFATRTRAVALSGSVDDLRKHATDTTADRSTGVLPLAPAPESHDLLALIERFRAAGVNVTYDWHGLPLPEDKGLHLALYRIAQEALTNVLRYAPTTPLVRVSVERGIGVVILEVENHAGPATAPMRGSGQGLIGMRERAAVYSGTVHAGPTPHGWMVHAVLRWDEENQGRTAWHNPR